MIGGGEGMTKTTMVAVVLMTLGVGGRGKHYTKEREHCVTGRGTRGGEGRGWQPDACPPPSPVTIRPGQPLKLLNKTHRIYQIALWDSEGAAGGEREGEKES